MISYLPASSDFFVNYGIEFYPLGFLAILVTLVLLSYAIAKYNLLDIEVIIKKTLVFTGLLAFVAGTVSLVVYLLNNYLANFVGINQTVATGIAIVTALLLYDPVKGLLVRLTECYLFQTKIDYEKIEEEVSNSIKITDLDKLCKTLTEIFYREMKLENALLLLFDEEKRNFRAGAQQGLTKEDVPILSEGDPFLAALEREPKVVFIKSDLPEDSSLLKEGLTRLRSEALAKVIFEDKLIAILSLGKKKSDEDYTTRDQQLLLKTANQMAVSISHANTFRLQRDYYVLQAQRNKSDALASLSAGLAHEIKNPLHMIRPTLEILLEEYDRKRLTSQVVEIGPIIKSSIKHTDRIIRIMDRLSRFARPIERKDIKLGPVPVKPFVEEAIGLIGQKQFTDDNIELEIQIPDSLPPVYADETSLVQVFYNLIVNAYHAINRNGKINVKAEEIPQDSRVLVTISDTGKGIPPENMEKIFEPFFTTKPTNVTPSMEERFTGTGLGLSFVKRYIEDLGGSVNVTSQVGKGTTFYLNFLRAGVQASGNINDSDKRIRR